MEKEVILRRAKKLMSRIGIQATTMDMIARECGISKRTLYKVFPDKKSLVADIVTSVNCTHKEEFTTIFSEADNVFEALLRIYHRIREYLQNTSFAFFDDIKRLYPEIHETHKSNEIAHIEKFAKAIDAAKEQGLVVERINSIIASTIFLTSIGSLQDNDLINEMQLNKVEVFDGAFINFMRGIATVKGLEIIENFLINSK